MSFARILLAAAAAATIVAPAFASGIDYRQNSTPAERAQTRALNIAAINGKVPAAAQARYDTQMAKYERGQADYRHKRAEYETLRARYEHQRAQYIAKRDAYDAMMAGSGQGLPAPSSAS